MELLKSLTGWMTKLNPAQERIAQDEGSRIGTDTPLTIFQAFDKLEDVNRGVNLIVNGCCTFDYDIKDKVTDGVSVGMKQKSLYKLLNYRPNPYQSVQNFRQAIFTDFILEGNAFVYFDGAFLYHLPAINMEVVPDPRTFINSYIYSGDTTFKADEVFMFSDISNMSIYRGESRLKSCMRTIQTLYRMQQFQDSFFENGAIPGLIMETENTLSKPAKDRTIEYWRTHYSPKGGARKPMIIDNGLKLKQMFDINFVDLDFDNSIKTHGDKILKALGVPTVLLEGGNNANITPNLRLFYLETIMPIVIKFASEVERYFGYDIAPVTNNVSALQPDLREVSAYHAALVNGGIETPAEAREALRLPILDDESLNEVRVPANIAGSATDPSTGGAPKKDDTET